MFYRHLRSLNSQPSDRDRMGLVYGDFTRTDGYFLLLTIVDNALLNRCQRGIRVQRKDLVARKRRKTRRFTHRILKNLMRAKRQTEVDSYQQNEHQQRRDQSQLDEDGASVIAA